MDEIWPYTEATAWNKFGTIDNVIDLNELSKFSWDQIPNIIMTIIFYFFISELSRFDDRLTVQPRRPQSVTVA